MDQCGLNICHLNPYEQGMEIGIKFVPQVRTPSVPEGGDGRPQTNNYKQTQKYFVS